MSLTTKLTKQQEVLPWFRELHSGECGEGIFYVISYAYSLDDLKEALGRIEEFCHRASRRDDNK